MSEADFLPAIHPVAVAIGPTIVRPRQISTADVPLVGQGHVVGGLRLEDLHQARPRLSSAIELELGRALRDLPREAKRAANRLLCEQGAFLLRKSVEEVADAMGVSRITIYNYVNALEQEDQR